MACQTNPLQLLQKRLKTHEQFVEAFKGLATSAPEDNASVNKRVCIGEGINEKVEEWDIIDDAEHILYSCTSRLWGELFRSSVPCPFSLDDPRVRKLPMDVRTPTLEELERVVTAVQFSEWSGNLPSFLNEPLMSKA